MNLIIFGQPGSGKGTQAKKISKYFYIPHISTGDMLREAIKEKACLGKNAQKFMSNGDLVPDELVVKILKERIKKEDCKAGFILDGFPRNLKQVELLSNILKETGRPIDLVINMIVSEEELTKRLLGRRVCSSCNKNFNIYQQSSNLKTSKCPVCNGELIIRDDDNMQTVRNRFKVYKEQTELSIQPYYKKDLVIEVDGEDTVENIFENIKIILEDIFDKD